jgi:hypothetical protein
MSAYVVSDAHVEVLLETALRGPRDAGKPWHGHQWFHANRWVHLEAATLRSVGQMLLAANGRSVEARYGDRASEFEDGGGLFEFCGYGHRLSCVEALKAVDCYAYQCNEADDWEQSEAFAFCRYLKDALVHALPGYEEAPWGWNPEILKRQGVLDKAAVR